MKQILTTVFGCGVTLLLFIFLPALGLRSGWMLALAIGAMLLCHMMHFGMRKDHKNGENDNERGH